MKVSDLLAARQTNWQELELLCQKLEGGSARTVPAATSIRFATLYRAACADLALADGYQLPPDTVSYLHQLVGRAHNQLYRSRMFQVRRWAHELFVVVPQRLFNDNYLRLAFCVFWGVFLISASVAYRSPEYAEQVISKELMLKMEEDYAKPVDTPVPGRGFDPSGRTAMAGFYIYNNAGIGLRCFAYGLILGVGGLYMTVFNAALIGAMFGHMATTPARENFFHFVTAHGPFELTAVVISAAAGMRLGFAVIDTRGLTRGAALRQAGQEAMPIMGAAILLFGLAALIEAFISPSPAPYWFKATVGVVTSGVLMFYLIGLGYPQED